MMPYFFDLVRTCYVTSIFEQCGAMTSTTDAYLATLVICCETVVAN